MVASKISSWSRHRCGLTFVEDVGGDGDGVGGGGRGLGACLDDVAPVALLADDDFLFTTDDEVPPFS